MLVAVGPVAKGNWRMNQKGIRSKVRRMARHGPGRLDRRGGHRLSGAAPAAAITSRPPGKALRHARRTVCALLLGQKQTATGVRPDGHPANRLLGHPGGVPRQRRFIDSPRMFEGHRHRRKQPIP